ncbi:hypothetical protein CC78DRAFT_533904 [Lojkania enalia]|uniref:Extracellular serine-rich protein n=1 Tax=Lojkania enalia TaxID=147567 RepID=A0A9P4K9D4_9PLEO|nr:hypothetical protein CC78DRAFT_533904 [Didymosphaeria enalia]
MVAFTSIAFAAAAIFGLTTAAPADPPYTGVTKEVIVGFTGANKGFAFEPNNVVAQPGDKMRFIFHPKNHSIVQSSFDEPCKPLEGGIFSGFNFATKEGPAPNVFEFKVKDTKPIWLYCSQTAGNHCQQGMVMVINSPFSPPKDINGYTALSKLTEVSTSPADIFTPIGGAIVAKNATKPWGY